MGTEIMRPQDILAVTRVRSSPLDRRRDLLGNRDMKNLNVNEKGHSAVHRKYPPKSDQKKFHKGAKQKKPTSADPRRKNGVSDGGLVMGRVTLLRRGESLGSLTCKNKARESDPTSPDRKPVVDLEVGDSDLVEPVSPLTLPKVINVQTLGDEYSGLPFYSSPSPRSVPVPSFFMKQIVRGEIKLSDDSASRDLRRLLRLD